MASKDDDKKVADSPKQKTRDHTPGVIDKDDPYADTRVDDLDEAANSPRDPVSHSVEPVKVTTIEDLGIGVRDPYPQGNPPPPNRDYIGRRIDDEGRLVDDEGKLIREDNDRGRTAKP